MDKLKELLRRCKCGVFLTVNHHRDFYETAERRLAELERRFDGPLEIEPAVRQTMIETNTVIELQFYPETPVRFELVYHHDLEAALDVALGLLPARLDS